MTYSCGGGGPSLLSADLRASVQKTSSRCRAPWTKRRSLSAQRAADWSRECSAGCRRRHLRRPGDCPRRSRREAGRNRPCDTRRLSWARRLSGWPAVALNSLEVGRCRLWRARRRGAIALPRRLLKWRRERRERRCERQHLHARDGGVRPALAGALVQRELDHAGARRGL